MMLGRTLVILLPLVAPLLAAPLPVATIMSTRSNDVAAREGAHTGAAVWDLLKRYTIIEAVPRDSIAQDTPLAEENSLVVDGDVEKEDDLSYEDSEEAVKGNEGFDNRGLRGAGHNQRGLRWNGHNGKRGVRGSGRNQKRGLRGNGHNGRDLHESEHNYVRSLFARLITKIVS